MISELCVDDLVSIASSGNAFDSLYINYLGKLCTHTSWIYLIMKPVNSWRTRAFPVISSIAMKDLQKRI